MNALHVCKTQLQKSSFFVCLSLIIGGYAIAEWQLIPRLMLAADEFVFARHIMDYTFHLPYRDFPPYKTILGYYLLSLPLYFSTTLWHSLLSIKAEIAFINFACLALISLASSRLFNKWAVLLAILAIIANQSFLIYGVDIRVDMLTSWAALFAILAVLANRVNLGGFLLGIAFLISQKALWYVMAIDGAMIIVYLAFASPLYSLRQIYRFNFYLILPILFYIITWSLIADFHTVIYNLFYEAYIQAKIDWYAPIYLICWESVLTAGPVLFLLWPFTLLSLLTDSADSDNCMQRLFIISLASIVLFLFMLYKQPFPYNFVYLIPAFFILYADFFSWGMRELNAYRIPLLLFIVFFLGTAVDYPLLATWLKSKLSDNRYQQTMVKVAENMLQNDDGYVAGIPFVYRKKQTIVGMKNLISPAVHYLSAPSAAIKPLLLASLYLTPTTTAEVIAAFNTTPVKLIINNYRIQALPPLLATYLNDHYQHYYGSLYLYAPRIAAGQQTIDVKWSGFYRVTTSNNNRIYLDGKRIKAAVIRLQQGAHRSAATRGYRLQWLPPVTAKKLDESYQHDSWQKMVRMILQ